MRKVVLLGCTLLLWVSPDVAGPQVLSWDPVPTATADTLEGSVDNGATWTATVTAPATGLILYRVGAANAIGRTTRFTAGVWVCESCAPPPPPANVGVN
jgi:hypothetical protein